MRFFKSLIPLLILAAGVGSFRYFSTGQEESIPLVPRKQIPVITAEKITITRASPTLRLYGTVETPDFGLLTAAIAADVTEVAVLEGDKVNKGDVLVRLDDTDVSLQLLQRRAEVKEIEALIESDRIRHMADQEALRVETQLLTLINKSVVRAQALVKSQVGAEAALDEAIQNEQRQKLTIIQRQHSITEFSSRQQQLQARRQKAEAILQIAEQHILRTSIVAPFSGRVAAVMVVAGDRVSQGSRLLHLYNEFGLELRVQVPSAFVSVIQRGLDEDKPITAFAIYNDLLIQLAFHRLSAIVEQGQGGVDTFFRAIEGHLPALGTTLAIRVNLPERDNVVLLPPDVLYSRNRVYTVVDGRLVARKVAPVGTRVDQDGNQMLLLDGSDFSPGDLVMTSRLPQAGSGLEVIVLDQ